MAQVLVEESALESIKAMCERLQQERDELLEALQGVERWADDNGKVFKLVVESNSGVATRIRNAIAKCTQEQ